MISKIILILGLVIALWPANNGLCAGDDPRLKQLRGNPVKKELPRADQRKKQLGIIEKKQVIEKKEESSIIKVNQAILLNLEKIAKDQAQIKSVQLEIKSDQDKMKSDIEDLKGKEKP